MFIHVERFNSADRFVVFNTLTNDWMQGEVIEKLAVKACDDLNRHEEKNNRPRVYAYKPVTEAEMVGYMRKNKIR